MSTGSMGTQNPNDSQPLKVDNEFLHKANGDIVVLLQFYLMTVWNCEKKVCSERSIVSTDSDACRSLLSHAYSVQK